MRASFHHLCLDRLGMIEEHMALSASESQRTQERLDGLQVGSQKLQDLLPTILNDPMSSVRQLLPHISV